MTEDDRPDKPLLGAYLGVVTRVDDPRKAGRVRLSVPGVADETGWALPVGNAGGGEAGLGFFAVPPVGAEALVFFLQGDADYPVYFPGCWGAPGGVTQVPEPAASATPAEAQLVRVFSTPRYRLAFDERPGKTSVELVDRVTGEGLTLDGTTLSVRLSGTTSVFIESTGVVDIKGLAVTIQGRPVVPGSGPI